ncbi:potassium channel family protein [Dietzia sp. 179-F 9C3 NHS]|uniref:potassium channel family protein n=1 Tax=Dietzia sp. 179-F 9C3 NHS TaxID=3374295 RepID=UPI0038792650
MRVIIMGCGRVGAALATELDEAGHEVVVIDRQASAFVRLPDAFRGRTITGVGFDQRVLEEAGVAGADAFAAVSSGDNSNIIAARVARERFGVERVIARIYDAGRAEVYERLGIPTIATVPWATRRFVHFLTGGSGPVVWRDETGSVSVVALDAPDVWVGARVDELGTRAGGRVVAVTRFGECRVPDARTLVQADDLLHLSLPSSALDDLDTAFATGPTDD